MKLDPKLVLGVAGLGAAAGIAYLGTRGVGPVKMTQFTELRQGPLQEHLITTEELGVDPAPPKVRYPAKVAPGLSLSITHGFAPLHQLPDPVAASLPAEQG